MARLLSHDNNHDKKSRNGLGGGEGELGLLASSNTYHKEVLDNLA
jgi:hypothetical protein